MELILMYSRESKKKMYFERISAKGNETDFTTHFNAIEEIKKGNRPEYLSQKQYEDSAIEIIEKDFNEDELIKGILEDLASEEVAVLRFYGVIWEVSRKDNKTEKMYIFNSSFEDEDFINKQERVIDELMEKVDQESIFLLFGGLYRLSNDRIGMYK